MDAPAIICGVNPENGRFFVGTKSVFNKVSPKISYSEEDVDSMYSAGQLAEKLKDAYKISLNTFNTKRSAGRFVIYR